MVTVSAMLADFSALRRHLGEIQAVFFDWDGVLADTMEENYRAWLEALAQVGVGMQREEYFIYEGRKVVEIAELQLTKAGKDRSLAAQVAKEKDRYYLEHAPAKLFPGVLEIIRRLAAQGLKLGLVSGATRRRLSHPLALEVCALLDVTVSGDDCGAGKPWPEPYLTAAKSVQIAPEKCLVIENAPIGVKSAKAAGMLCIAVTSTLDRSYLQEADWIVDEIGQVAALMDSCAASPERKRQDTSSTTLS